MLDGGGPWNQHQRPYRKRGGHPETPRDECLATTEAEAGVEQPRAKEQHQLIGNSGNRERSMRWSLQKEPAPASILLLGFQTPRPC